ncbi:MAG: NAD(P)-dependent oxidoreductase [Actinobacteria bacterium]|nr:NAD(P)-dependent oxidoreductase [Actinomycetota bacterium]
MRIFVAGATGVLGRRVVPALVDRGHAVTGVARSADKADQLRAQRATPASVDLFDPAAVTAAVDGNDVVINLATSIPPTSRMLRPSAWRTNDRLRTEASRHLVNAAPQTGAERHVQEALAFIYPESGAAWIDEDVPPDAPSSVDAVLSAEAQVHRFAAGGGSGVVLRFGLFYSADSAQTRDMLTLIRRGLLPQAGANEAYQSWVHVDDAAAAVVAALDVGSGTYNVVEDDPLTNAEHTRVLSELVGRRVRRLPRVAGVGPLAFQARSQRVSNRRLCGATSWRPAFGSRRDGWTQVANAARHVITGA